MNQTQTVSKTILGGGFTDNEGDTFHTDSSQIRSELSETLNDFYNGVKDWRFWWSLSTAEIKKRYQRTTFGPLWATLNLGFFIGIIGVLFSLLWKMNMKEYLPYFTSGYICWVFISAIISESCSTFIRQEGILKNIPVNYTSFAWNLVTQNILVLAHHFIIYVLVVIFMGVSINLNTLLLMPGLLLISLTGVGVAIILGLLCARYRDIQQGVTSVLQICLFCTPIFWSAEQFKGTKLGLLMQANPMLHYIKLMREPLMGQAPSMFTWVAASSSTLFVLCCALYIYARYHRKLIYWL